MLPDLPVFQAAAAKSWIDRVLPAAYLLALVVAVMLLSTFHAFVVKRAAGPRENADGAIGPSHRAQVSDRMTAAEIFAKVIGDVPALLGVGLTGAIILLAVTDTDVPKILSDAFLIVIGYYFGERTARVQTRSSREEPKTPSADSILRRDP